MIYILSTLFMLSMVGAIAFFAGVETGLFSISKPKIRNMVEKGDKRARIVMDLLDRPDYFIGTALVGINFAHVTLAVVSAWYFNTIFKNMTVSALVTAGVLTPLLLLFGEILPKMIFRLRPHATTLYFAPIFRTIYVVLQPVTWAVLAIAHFIIPATQDDIEKDAELRREEIRSLVREGEKSGVVEDDEKKMIESAFELGEKTVREVMVPRVSMAAMSSHMSYKEMLEYAVAEGYTRFPVYDETPDEIMGILHVTDLLVEDSPRQEAVLVRPGSFDPEKLAKPFYVPEFTRVDEALEQLRSQGGHLAIAVDEYGGTAGIVTIEDLLEELVGEIDDEFDDSHAKAVRIGEGAWSVDARVDIEEAAEALGNGVSFEDEKGEAETIGGMIMEQLGRIPRVGEKLDIGNARVEITAADERRIIRVTITPNVDVIKKTGE